MWAVCSVKIVQLCKSTLHSTPPTVNTKHNIQHAIHTHRQCINATLIANLCLHWKWIESYVLATKMYTLIWIVDSVRKSVFIAHFTPFLTHYTTHPTWAHQFAIAHYAHLDIHRMHNLHWLQILLNTIYTLRAAYDYQYTVQLVH